MEFLRFGSNIPGIYWGCCAVCIIQNFKFDPKEKSSIQLVSGDGGSDLGGAYMGPTWEDIFRERIRTGTFSKSDMPNHVFLAVLTQSQIGNPDSVGYKWLKILKEEGFEFVRTTDNSVYTSKTAPSPKTASHNNCIFGLFRNISGSKLQNPFVPPKEWTDLPEVIPEAYTMVKADLWEKMAADQSAVHLQHWKDHGPTKFVTRSSLEKDDVPIMMAGKRGGALPHWEKGAKTKAA